MDDLPQKSDTNEDRILSLENEIRRMREEAEERYLKLDNLPSNEELGYEIPVTKFDTDREYLKFQKDGPNLTMWFNPDALKKSLAGGGLGGGASGTSGAGTLTGRIASATGTGVVDARGNSVQWTYAIIQLKAGAVSGYGEWVNNVDGYAGVAYNDKEDDNTGMGVQGNGFDVDWTAYTDNDQLMFQPIRDIVQFRLVQAQDGSIAAWFSEPNLIGGNCGSGSG